LWRSRSFKSSDNQWQANCILTGLNPHNNQNSKQNLRTNGHFISLERDCVSPYHSLSLFVYR
jgi:hypothetical protein